MVKVFSHIFPGGEHDIIAIDGKTLKVSVNKSKGIPAMHAINAWSVKNGICLAQLTNEANQDSDEP